MDDESAALRDLARRISAELEARRADLERVRSWAAQARFDAAGVAAVPADELLALLDSLSPAAPRPEPEAPPAPIDPED
jgi:hypothetical protein